MLNQFRFRTECFPFFTSGAAETIMLPPKKERHPTMTIAMVRAERSYSFHDNIPIVASTAAARNMQELIVAG